MAGTLTLTHGLPGSGKSSWAVAEAAKDPKNRVQISRDDLRTELFGESYHTGKFPKKSEDKVTALQQKRFREAFAKGLHVYSDDTHLTPFLLESLVRLARNYGVKIEQVHFDVPVEECKRRNAARGAAGGRLVPDFVIDRMAEKAYDEDGHLKEFLISSNGSVSAASRSTPGMKLLAAYSAKLEERYPLVGEAVVLVDIDGTLADNRHDSNHAFGRAGEKKDYNLYLSGVKSAPVNESVRDLANAMRDNDQLNIMVLSGRSDSHAAELIAFIERSGLKASRVLAKRDGDFRQDSDFKVEQLQKLKEEGLVVVHSIDDRARSIAIYERAGIMVSRVPEHIPEDPATAPASYPAALVQTIYGSGHCIRCGKPLKSGNIGPQCRLRGGESE